MEFLKEYLDHFIFGLLGFMAFIALWVTIERLLFYRKVDITGYNHAERLNIALTNNLSYISTIGANAPYVGLLGTVLGILITFYELGQQATIDTGIIMTSLALALKATAAGIALAIPSIMIFNGFIRRTEVYMGEFRASEDLKRSQNTTQETP